jgi:formyltetrahydrofolate deformylase
MANRDEFILTLSWPDRAGIVHAVTGFLTQHNLNIVDSQQFGDPTSKKNFMRVHFAPVDAESKVNLDDLYTSFNETAQLMSMDLNSLPRPANPGSLLWFPKLDTA